MVYVAGPLSIRNVRVNCDGSRVAIIADYIEGSLKVNIQYIPRESCRLLNRYPCMHTLCHYFM